ncbi:PBSX family phage terminase large subunit [Neobacillus niacini]|uniref:PBSX family phage terminase large subunit n=1 Tax=Neobacillus niacini TaxID=86668 RepID=UPI0030006CB3
MQSVIEVNEWDIIAPAFREVSDDIVAGNHTHYWLSGGRGSTKSSFISVEIILGIMEDENANAMVLRKVKDTLRDSVYEQLVWAIGALGVTHKWEIPEAKLVLTYLPTGQKILFRGADKPKKIKSAKVKKGYFKYIWYEELDEFSGMEEIRMINQSLMRGGEDFVVFYSYNPPQSANNWVNAEKKLTRPDRYVHHSNYLTVPREWLGQIFITEAEHLKQTKLKAYEHEYLGDVTGTGGEVFDNVTCRPITDEEIKEFWNIKRGIDYGYATDPFAYGVMHYDRKKKRLYIFHEHYKVRLSNREAYEHIKEENKDNALIKAESAEPKSNHELRQYGLKVVPVKKGPDSIKYGIKFLQSLEAIIIDDVRCPETAREFLQYELDKDVNGNFKADYPDKNNHTIDMARYALNDEVMKFKEEQQHKHDPDNLTPSEKQAKAIKQMTGGKPKVSAYTRW